MRRLEMGNADQVQLQGLTRTGDGHTSVYTSDCAKSAAETFLVEGRGTANQICDG